MDNTIIIGTGFLIVYWAVFFILVGLLYFFVKSIYKTWVSENPMVLKSHVALSVGIVVISVVFYYLNNAESAYRPRTKIEGVVRSSSRHDKEIPFVSTSNAPTWNEKMATNRLQNEAARQEFEKLPDAK